MQETWVCSLGREDPREKGMATHSFSCLENSMGRRAWQATGIGSQRIRPDWGTALFYDTFTPLVKPQRYVHEAQMSPRMPQRPPAIRKEERKTEDWPQQRFHFFREKSWRNDSILHDKNVFYTGYHLSLLHPLPSSFLPLFIWFDMLDHIFFSWIISSVKKDWFTGTAQYYVCTKYLFY